MTDAQASSGSNGATVTERLPEIQTLRASGWTYQKIADFLGVPLQAVYSRLRHYKPDHAEASDSTNGNAEASDLMNSAVAGLGSGLLDRSQRLAAMETLRASGWTYQKIADFLRLSRQRVHSLMHYKPAQRTPEWEETRGRKRLARICPRCKVECSTLREARRHCLPKKTRGRKPKGSSEETEPRIAASPEKQRQHGPKKETGQITFHIEDEIYDRLQVLVKQTGITQSAMCRNGTLLAMKELDETLSLLSINVRSVVCATTKPQQRHVMRLLVLLVADDLSPLEIVLRNRILEDLELIEKAPGRHERAMELYKKQDARRKKRDDSAED